MWQVYLIFAGLFSPNITVWSNTITSYYECSEVPGLQKPLWMRVLKKSHVSKQNLPSPERYGWELNGISLGPVMKDNLLATLAPIELSICNCKGDCSTRRCICFKNSLLWTDMCKCSACNNSNTLEDDNQEISEHDESDVEDYTWHYLFGIFTLKTLSKMSGAFVI